MADPFDPYNPNGMMRSYNTAPSEILARIQAGGQMLTNPYVTNVTGGGSTPAPVAPVVPTPVVPTPVVPTPVVSAPQTLFTPMLSPETLAQIDAVKQAQTVLQKPTPVAPTPLVPAPQVPLFTPVQQQDPVTPPSVPVDPSVFANEIDVFGGSQFDSFFDGVYNNPVNIDGLPGGGVVEGSPLDVLNKLASGELTPEQAKEQYPESYAALYGDYEQQIEENQTDPEVDAEVDTETNVEPEAVEDERAPINPNLRNQGTYVPTDTDNDGVWDALLDSEGTRLMGGWTPEELETIEKQKTWNATQKEIYDNVTNSEGFENLENWEKDKALKDAGYTGGNYNSNPTSDPGWFNDGNAEPPEEPEDVDAEEEGSWIDKLPSFEDLMGKIRDAAKDAVPSTAEEWGDLIRSILKAEGVNLPSGNIDDILAGGYGVRWDDFSRILKNIQEGVVFVPGLPGGVSPGSVDIGTIKDILSQPENVAKEVLDKIVGAVKDPTTILSGVFGNTDEIPDWLEAAILAGDYGQDALDWLKGISGGSEEEETVIPVTETPEDETEETPEEEAKLTFGGESAVDENPEEEIIIDTSVEETPEEEVDITQDDTTEDLQEDGKLVFGHEGGKPVTETETIEEIITGTASEDIDTSDQSKLTFGGEGEREEEIIINGDPNEEEQEEELTTGSSGGGGGGGGGESTPFMSGISYQLPTIGELIQSPNVDYNAQLNAIINRNVGLFEGMV